MDALLPNRQKPCAHCIRKIEVKTWAALMTYWYR
jgi:hypothetical protein